MTTKTTRKDFQTFQAEFRRWQQRLGLTGYKIYFQHAPLDDSFADIGVAQIGRVGRARLTTRYEQTNDKVGREGFSASQSGRHEALELLLSRLEWLAGCRNVDEDEVREEVHAVIRRLENLFDEVKM